MATLKQLRDRFLVHIDQVGDGGRFTDIEANILINEAQEKVGVIISQPRDWVSIVSQLNVGVYNYSEDHLFTISAYFGDPNPAIQKDVKKLEYVSLQTMDERYPGWQADGSESNGRPAVFTNFNQFQILAWPKPDAANAGKRLFLCETYTPNPLDTDSQECSLPVQWHSDVALYAAYLAYLGKLQKFDVAAQFRKDFYDNIKLTEDPLKKEVDNAQAFEWVGNGPYGAC